MKVKTKFPDADFWIVRRGSIDAVGQPTKEYNPENFGIRVNDDAREAVLLPSFLYYLMRYVHQEGWYRVRATGTTNLMSIDKKSIEDITVER